jgi:hypothetical protein
MGMSREALGRVQACDHCIEQDQLRMLLAYGFVRDEMLGGTERDLNRYYACLESLHGQQQHYELV